MFDCKFTSTNRSRSGSELGWQATLACCCEFCYQYGRHTVQYSYAVLAHTIRSLLGGIQTISYSNFGQAARRTTTGGIFRSGPSDNCGNRSRLLQVNALPGIRQGMAEQAGIFIHLHKLQKGCPSRQSADLAGRQGPLQMPTF